MILRDHGRFPGDILFQNHEVAYKYKMSNLQAALVLAQLERINELITKKKQIFKWYQDAFIEFRFLNLNPDQLFVNNSYLMTTAIFSDEIGLKKFDIVKFLSLYNISTRPFFEPLSSLKAYEDYKDTRRAKEENIVSYNISQRGINLPSGANIEIKDIEQVKNAINFIIKS
jgi:perosamine synthetase